MSKFENSINGQMKSRRNTDRDSLLLEEEGDLEESVKIRGNIKGDEKNLAILLILYILQGIPIGLSAAIPMILQKYNVSYKQQAQFSLVIWPFSLKLFWAPLVDTFYVSKFGQRKTWLVPVQYLMGFFMLFLSSNIDGWLNDKDNLRLEMLTVLFFILNLLAATQDIAVDGWALTMLKRCNVSHASTCNTVGQTTGYFLGYVLFLALESPNLCNSYLRLEPKETGMVTLPDFLYFWGWTFIVVTTLIGIFKHEKAEAVPKDKDDMSILHAYKLLWRIVNLSNIKEIMMLTLTAKIGFAACDAVTSLKMVESGMPKESLALMAVPLIPVQIVLPIFLSKFTVGSRPLDIYLKAYPYRLAFGVVAAALVWITPWFVQNAEVPGHFMALIIGLFFIHQLTVTSMYVGSMAFFARISDPTLGGTYMSFLNTLSNLGGNWPSTAALWFVDSVTFGKCSSDPANTCSDAESKKACASIGNGKCTVTWDGYYILSALCMVIGWVWLRWARNRIVQLQGRHLSTWKIRLNKS